MRVLSVSRGQVLKEFPTVFGGVLGRLALCGPAENDVLVVGGWATDGVAAYRASTGALLWHRRDLPEAYALSAAGTGEHVAISFARAPMHVLDTTSGEVLARVKGIRTYHQSRYGLIGAGQLDGAVSFVDAAGWKLGVRLPIRGFAMLGVAFAPAGCVISDTTEPEGPVLSSVMGLGLGGELRWRLENSRSVNVPWMTWHAASERWLGIARHVDRKSADVLHGWSDAGEELFRLRLDGHAEYAFTADGSHLVAGNKVLDPLTGTVTGRF